MRPMGVCPTTCASKSLSCSTCMANGVAVYLQERQTHNLLTFPHQHSISPHTVAVTCRPGAVLMQAEPASCMDCCQGSQVALCPSWHCSCEPHPLPPGQMPWVVCQPHPLPTGHTCSCVSCLPHQGATELTQVLGQLVEGCLCHGIQAATEQRRGATCRYVRCAVSQQSFVVVEDTQLEF
jgi:hypothetical protein